MKDILYIYIYIYIYRERETYIELSSDLQVNRTDEWQLVAASATVNRRTCLSIYIYIYIII